MIKMITQKLLKELFHYNLDTGIFTRKVSRGGNIKGSVAGCVRSDGYVLIGINYENYYAHILAWLYVKGKFPEGEIDHKDTIHHHNWISNLRDVTHAGNMQNQIKARSDNKSTGELGITFRKERNKFCVRFIVDGKPKYFGDFSTLKIAKGVRDRAKRKHHSTCTL